MLHVYKCDFESANNILKAIEPNTEYIAFVFENRLSIDFVVPRSLLDVDCDKLLIEASPGDATHIIFENKNKRAQITTTGLDVSINNLSKCFDFEEHYINFIENIISPSCPLNVISTINLEKELYIREIGENREVTDEW